MGALGGGCEHANRQRDDERSNNWARRRGWPSIYTLPGRAAPSHSPTPSRRRLAGQLGGSARVRSTRHPPVLRAGWPQRVTARRLSQLPRGSAGGRASDSLAEATVVRMWMCVGASPRAASVHRCHAGAGVDRAWDLGARRDAATRRDSSP
jgi:hypothetical protein